MQSRPVLARCLPDVSRETLGDQTGLVADFDEAVSRETVAGDTAVQKEDLWGQIPLNFASHCRWVGLAFGR